MKILVVDDHAVVRQGVQRLLSSIPNAVVLEAATAHEALAIARKEIPDVVVLDINLEAASGLELLRRILIESPSMRVLMFSMHAEPIYANRADVAPFRTRLDAALATSNDLGTIMRADAELAREIGAVDSYYVAVEPNCVFQPVSVTHFVRRTRG